MGELRGASAAARDERGRGRVEWGGGQQGRIKAEEGPIIEKFTLHVYFPGLVNITASHENRGFEFSEGVKVSS